MKFISRSRKHPFLWFSKLRPWKTKREREGERGCIERGRLKTRFMEASEIPTLHSNSLVARFYGLPRIDLPPIFPPPRSSSILPPFLQNETPRVFRKTPSTINAFLNPMLLHHGTIAPALENKEHGSSAWKWSERTFPDVKLIFYISFWRDILGKTRRFGFIWW